MVRRAALLSIDFATPSNQACSENLLPLWSVLIRRTVRASGEDLLLQLLR
jgi:hypothetical protein